MKGTEVPNPGRSSACDYTHMLTRIDHCLVNNSSICSRVDMACLWYQFIPNCLSSNLFQQLSTLDQY